MPETTLVALAGLAPALSASRMVDVLRQQATLADRTRGFDLVDLIKRTSAGGGAGADGLAEALVSLLDEENLPRVDIVAESISATAALRFAARYPDRIGRLVLIAPVGYARPLSGTWSTRAEFADAVRDLFLGDPQSSDAALDLMCGGARPRPANLSKAFRRSSQDAEVAKAVSSLAEWLETGAFHPVELREGDGLRQTKAPVDLVWGRDDRLSGLDAAFYLNRRLKEIQLRVFSDCGHLVLEQGGSRVARHIASVLAADNAPGAVSFDESAVGQ